MQVASQAGWHLKMRQSRLFVACWWKVARIGSALDFCEDEIGADERRWASGNHEMKPFREIRWMEHALVVRFLCAKEISS